MTDTKINDPRRGMDKVVRGVLVTLLVTLVIQGAGGLIYAGRLDARVSFIEKHVAESRNQESRILKNELEIIQSWNEDKEILILLNEVNNRQREMQIKLEKLIR